MVIKLEGGTDDDVADVMREYDDCSDLAIQKRLEEEKRRDERRVKEIALKEGVEPDAGVETKPDAEDKKERGEENGDR